MLLTKTNPRVIAMSGGVLCGTCIAACAFLTNLGTTGVCLTLSGAGLSMVYTPIHLSLNDYFPDKFVLMNTVSLYGYTAGSVLLPILIEKSLKAYGYYGAFLILGGVAFNSTACAATIRTVPSKSTRNEENDQVEPDKRKCFSGGKSLKIKREEEVDEEISEQSRLMQSESGCDRQETSLKSKPTCRKTFFEACKRSCGLWKEPLFIFSLPIHFLQSYTIYSWMLFLVPHTEQLGIQSSKAVYLSTIGGIGGIIGRTLFIILLSKGVNAFAVYVSVGCICTGTFLMDFVCSDYRSRAALAFVQGFSFFIEDAIAANLCKGAVFDDGNIGTAFAISIFMCGLGATLAGTFTGHLFDITQSFTKVFIINGFIHAFMVGHLFIVAILIKRKRLSD
ncbi:monocarboxylate transporter 6-like [Lytechinus variegatus]|uniref:monocarboxylate transporter 6-like n=1 Tax=Lytechinus variegatus TaxID=7654 RepID=UPI001BB11DCB|nr:monocarboxylate transporter 6-like [Lytechinus variegatus]